MRNCKSKLDVGFIIDSSGSARNNYDNEKFLVKILAERLGLGLAEQSTRCGVITFSYHAKVEIKLRDHNDTATFYHAVDKIPYMGSTTRIDKALRAAQKELFTSQNGGRKDTAKFLVLFTDGPQSKTDGAEDPVRIANELRSDGITILVIGWGSNVNSRDLLRIAGGDESHMIRVTSFIDDLYSELFIKKVVEISCNIGK